MRLIISAIGLLKKGPESELVADYLKRLRGQAKQIGISQIDILEAKERTGGDDKKNLEAELLISQMPSDRKLIALDEHGRHITSRELANLIQKISTRVFKIFVLLLVARTVYPKLYLNWQKIKYALVK